MSDPFIEALLTTSKCLADKLASYQVNNECNQFFRRSPCASVNERQAHPYC
jgi:hypothetical protein